MKKSILMGIIFLVAVLFICQTVAAVSIGSLDILSASGKRRSNPNADDADDEDLYVSAESFTITNDQAATITNVTISCSADSDYNVTFSQTGSFNLSVGSNSLTVNARVPKDLISFVSNNAEDNYPGVNDDREFKICDVQVKNSTSDVIATVPLYMEAKNYLEIDRVEIYVNGNKVDSFSSDDKKVDDLRPGDEIKVKVKVENKYDDSDPEDLEFEDVDVKIIIEDDDLDVEEDDDISTIEADSYDDDIELEFEIDEDANSGDYDMYIIISGDDENGAAQGEIWKIELEVIRKTHEISIVDMSYPDELVCGESSFKFSVDLRNTGKKDEKYAAVKVSSTDFGFTEKLSDLDLDKNDDTSEIFTISIPEDITSGNKIVKIETFYSKTKESNEDSVIIKYPVCVVAADTTSTDDSSTTTDADDDVTVIVDSGVDTQTSDSDDESPVIAGTTPITTTESFFDSTTYMVILIIAVIVIIGLVTTLGIFVKKNKE